MYYILITSDPYSILKRSLRAARAPSQLPEQGRKPNILIVIIYIV